MDLGDTYILSDSLKLVLLGYGQCLQCVWPLKWVLPELLWFLHHV